MRELRLVFPGRGNPSGFRMFDQSLCTEKFGWVNGFAERDLYRPSVVVVGVRRILQDLSDEFVER